MKKGVIYARSYSLIITISTLKTVWKYAFIIQNIPIKIFYRNNFTCYEP